MHLSEILTAELDAFAARTKKKKLDILETGTIRGEGDNYREGDGWSTVTFAEWVKKNGGTVTSIDLKTDVSAKVLKAKSLDKHVELIEGHSVEVLASMVANAWANGGAKAKGDNVPVNVPGKVDVAFLDSDNCGALIFHEYLVVKQLMRSPGLIIVDDVDIESDGVVKGHEILPWAKANGIEHRVVERQGNGYKTGLLIFEV